MIQMAILRDTRPTCGDPTRGGVSEPEKFEQQEVDCYVCYLCWCSHICSLCSRIFGFLWCSHKKLNKLFIKIELLQYCSSNSRRKQKRKYQQYELDILASVLQFEGHLKALNRASIELIQIIQSN